MLSHSSYTFGGSSLHSDILPQGIWQPQLVTEEFFGVAGEAHINGAWGGRDLVCDYDLTGFATAADLGNQLVAIDAQINQLTGTLTISGNINGTYPKCTFLGYERAGMFFDGSGINGWCVFGRLRWRQRNQS